MAKRRVGVEYSPSILEPVRPGAVSPDRALCLPTFSHFLIVKSLSLALLLSLSLSQTCTTQTNQNSQVNEKKKTKHTSNLLSVSLTHSLTHTHTLSHTHTRTHTLTHTSTPTPTAHTQHKLTITNHTSNLFHACHYPNPSGKKKNHHNSFEQACLLDTPRHVSASTKLCVCPFNKDISLSLNTSTFEESLVSLSQNTFWRDLYL